jgi:hypothetical protein
MRRAIRWALLTSAIVAVLGAPAGAHAAPADSDPAAVEAQSRFDEGLARVKAGDFAGARVSFEQAYAVLHRPRILWNLALSEEKTGHLAEALTHFKQVVRDPATSETDRANGQLHIESLGHQTGHVDVQAPPGVTLSVDGGPPTAVTPLAEPLDVSVGHHVIEAALPQGTKSLAVDALAGQVARVSFVSSGEEAPAVVPPPSPTVPSQGPVVDEPPPAAVPGEGTQTAPGNGARIGTTATVGGLAVVSIALGVYFGVQSRNDADKAATYRSQNGSSTCVSPMGGAVATCTAWNNAVQAQNREATASAAFYIAGGVLAAGAVATWFLWPRSANRSTAALWIAPSIAPGLAAVGAGGAF